MVTTRPQVCLPYSSFPLTGMSCAVSLWLWDCRCSSQGCNILFFSLTLLRFFSGAHFKHGEGQGWASCGRGWGWVGQAMFFPWHWDLKPQFSPDVSAPHAGFSCLICLSFRQDCGTQWVCLQPDFFSLQWLQWAPNCILWPCISALPPHLLPHLANLPTFRWFHVWVSQACLCVSQGIFCWVTLCNLL